jgi:hypothetical protein
MSPFLGVIRDKNAFFSYSAKIETLFIVFSVSTLSPAKAADKFSAVLLASVRSFT